MSNHQLIKFCSPTLAGIKISNLFSHKFNSISELSSSIKSLNGLLNQKGVYVVLLRINLKNKTALVLVYRKEWLCEMLNSSRIQNFLKRFGYDNFELSVCLQKLRGNLKSSDFPHEIGVFLGYPLADIISFINNKGCNFKCVGCWKVYHNLDKALATFDKYAKCQEIYMQKLINGEDIFSLTVAC